MPLKNRKTLVLFAIIGLLPMSAGIAAAGEPSRFGHFNSGRLAGGSSQSGGLHVPFGPVGSLPNLGSSSSTGRHFGDGKQFHGRKFFRPRQHFGQNHIIVPDTALHDVDQSVIMVNPPPAVVINPGPKTTSDANESPAPRIIDVETALARPIITPILGHREKLGLSAEQVRALEVLRDRYGRDATRHVAAIRREETELRRLSSAKVIELAKIEAKLRDIAGLKAALRHTRIRTIEQGRRLLSTEQRVRLQTLLGDPYGEVTDGRH